MHVNRLFGDQLWKERLTFVSGNILGLGLILVKLRPIIAQLQLESFFDIVLYTTLLFLMTAAFSAIIFAVIHIVFRGAWLATFNKKRRVQIQEKKIVENFDNFCVLSYFAVFILSVCTILSILVTFGTSLIIIFKDITNFYFPSIKYISPFIFILSLLIFIIIVLYKFTKFLRNIKKIEHISKVYYLTIFVFFLVLIWTLSTCFTLDISLNKDIFDRSQNEKIEIYIKLGGATSDIDKVNVMLFDSLNNPINDKIIMHYRDSGEYFTYIDSSKLSSGYYKVTLTYSESPVLKRPFSATPEGFFVV